MAIKKNSNPNIQRISISNKRANNGEIIWINIVNAEKAELEFLRKKYNFKISHLQISSIKAVAQRTAIEYADNYLLLVLHFPSFVNGNIVRNEIDFFIGDNFIVTLHDNKLPALGKFFNLCKKDSASTLSYKFESTAILLYEIIEKLMLDCYTLLDQNSINIAQLEDLIFSHESRKAVSQILALRRNIINTRKILLNHKNIIKELSEIEYGAVPEHRIKKYYNELLGHSKRIWENLEIQKEMIEILNNTNESMLNYQISNIMKTLTIFSVIVFPLTLLAAIFGMNVVNGMPFMDNPNGFWIIIAIMLVGSLGMLAIFEKKKWL